MRRGRSWIAVLFLLSAAACPDNSTGPSGQGPPELVSLEFASDHVTSQPNQPVTAQLRVTARDEAGIAEVSADFTLPDSSTRGCTGTLADGEKTDGVWQCNITIGPSDPAGDWRLHEVHLQDEAGNSVSPTLPSSAPVLHVVDGSLGDLTIRYIERLPRMEWVLDSSDPSREGWPAEGQQVEWRAHVRNWSPSAREVPYAWYVDDVPAGSGTISIPGDTTATASLPWTWTFDRHRIRFVVDPDNRIPATSTATAPRR